MMMMMMKMASLLSRAPRFQSHSFRFRSDPNGGSFLPHNTFASFSSKSILSQSYPSKILLVKKPNDQRATSVLESLISFIKSHDSSVDLFVEQPNKNDTRARRFTQDDDDQDKVDLVIALGGDGTVLHIASLFKRGACPDILGFNLGTIGFLLPFHVEAYQQVLKQVFKGNIKKQERMRLSCTFKRHPNHPHTPQTELDEVDDISLSAVNDISVHRSQYPHMTPIHISVNGQHLTKAVADGLLIATPTGSTAYSCSAGGPIVHPAVDALLITPICPRSLSFRPLVLPANTIIQLTLDRDARAAAELSLDGISTSVIHPGQSLSIGKSAYPIKLLSPGDGWVEDLNVMLNFNRPYASKVMA